MRYLVTGKEMKLLDQNTSAYYNVPELVLMEQAALTFVWKLSSLFSNANLKKGIIFCGTGNNGADGMAIARLLNEKGISAEVCRIKDIWKLEGETSASYKVQESIYTAYNYPVQNNAAHILKENYDFMIDAVFGIGLSRNLEAEYVQIIELMNCISAVKIAVDMPSGINSDNGQVMGCAAKCDYTITFSFGKIGQYLWPGCEYAGQTIVVDMGITHRSWLEKEPSMVSLEADDVYNLPARPEHSNKGTFGKLLIIAGSKNMAGAAILSAKAAYHNGTGLVKIFSSEENRSIIQTAVPEAVLSTYNSQLDREQLKKELRWADAIVIGPGIGTSNLADEMIEIVNSNATVPIVWDADALNLIAKKTSDWSYKNTSSIITPHLGEFSRLTNLEVSWIQNNLVESAVKYARSHNVICVLKDFHTFIANSYGLNYLNLSGNNGMATAGSGDVLTGIIGAFLAQGMNVADAAAYGVMIHGMAGDAVKAKTGTRGMTASDIIDGIKEVWNKVENK